MSDYQPIVPTASPYGEAILDLQHRTGASAGMTAGQIHKPSGGGGGGGGGVFSGGFMVDYDRYLDEIDISVSQDTKFILTSVPGKTPNMRFTVPSEMQHPTLWLTGSATCGMVAYPGAQVLAGIGFFVRGKDGRVEYESDETTAAFFEVESEAALQELGIGKQRVRATVSTSIQMPTPLEPEESYGVGLYICYAAANLPQQTTFLWADQNLQIMVAEGHDE